MRILCRALEVHPGGYYAWLSQPLSERDIEDKRLTGQIKQFWLESGGHSGYRRPIGGKDRLWPGSGTEAHEISWSESPTGL